MTRARAAAVLGVVALLCVLGTAAVAMTRPDGDDPPMLTVAHDGSSFEVPADGWKVTESDVRIFYADGLGRPAAVVHGPAVFDAGYCGRGSNRAFAGFTEQPLAAWTGALGEAGDAEREQVTLADGTDATLARVVVAVEARGRCSVPEVEVSMIEADGVRVVLVQDAGTLPDDDLLLSLELP